MQDANSSNPNDFKVVSFHNSTDFGFTPDMGCMYDGRSINGKNGSPGIDAGETVILPYHIANQLATNLAKVMMTKLAPTLDPAGIPTGVPLWDVVKLENTKQSFLSDLYTEAKPVAMSETDKLMAKVEEYKLMVEKLIPKDTESTNLPTSNTSGYKDKAEVLKELEIREIKHDKRKSKDELEKLLA